MNILTTNNTLHQLNLLEKYCNPSFLKDKTFTEDRNGNSPQGRSIERVTMIILYSLIVQFKGNIKQQSTLCLVSKTVHYYIDTSKILTRRQGSTEIIYPYSIAKRCTHINGSHQTVNMSSPPQSYACRPTSAPLLPA
jgi:hypothetical protein